MIYANFENIVEPKNNGEQNLICDNVYVNGDVDVRDHCHITRKYRGSAGRDCNNNVKLNNKIPIVFHNLKNHGSHFIMQEQGKFNLKINVIPNILEEQMRFNLNNKLIFIDTFQFFCFSLDSLVKNLGKDNLKYLGEEFDNKVLDLAK